MLSSLKEKGLSFVQKIGGIKVIALLMGFLAIAALLSILVFQTAKQENYAVLYTHLSPDDAGNVLGALQEEKVPYKVEGDGTIIMVPKERVYDVRLKLAAKGLPATKVIGLELFEEPKMGTTQFQESINFLRAIEGELVRTIKQLDAVMDAKVNVALPKESIFAREEEEPKASVIIKLWPGKDLSKEQIKAIVFLVSHSVAKLKTENVTVVDNLGRVLSDLLDDKLTEGTGEKSMDAKRALELRIEKSVQSMLAKALGAENVVVRASVEIETGKLHQQDELYDPERTAVVSERKIQENERSNVLQTAGAPGTASNVPPVLDTTTTGGGGVQERSKKDTTTNYDVSKSVIETQKPIFTIKRLSVGVLIGNSVQETTDANGSVIKRFVPRSSEELKSYENLIKSVVGYDEKRGDRVTVVSMPFEAQAAAAELSEEGLGSKNMALLVAIVVLGLVLLALLGYMGMRYVRGKKAPPPIPSPEAPEVMEEIRAARQKEAAMMEFEKEPAYNKIVEITQTNPELVASLIGRWLREESKP